MTQEEFRKRFNNDALREIVQKQTDLTCDAYQQGWQDCYDLFSEWLKARGIIELPQLNN